MTVPSATSSVSYAGNGSTQIFSVPFYFLDDTHLVVQTVTAGVATTKVLNADYTVSGAGNESGGEVTMLSAPAVGTKVYIFRQVPLTQLKAYVENTPFPAAAQEQALDQLTMAAQQLYLAIQGALRLSTAAVVDGVSGALPEPLGGSLIGWKQDGSGLANVGASGVGAGSITDVNVSSSAAIQGTKLAFNDATSGLGASTVQAAIDALAVKVKPSNAVDQVFREAHDGQAITIVCLGDSITWGYRPDGLQASLPYPTRLQNLLRQYYGNANIQVINAGVSGNTVQAMIDRWATDVAAHNPDLIVFNGGTNDAREVNNVSLSTYAANVLQILQLAGSTPVVVMGITPRFKEQKSGDGEGVIDFYRRTLKMLAEYYHLPYVDTFTRFHNLYKTGGYRAGTLSTDGSHYTDDGYVLLGEIVFVDAFANDNLTIKPGQFKDLRGQWLVTAAADSTWGGIDSVDSNSVVIAANATVSVYIYLDEWQNASLAVHATIDNASATGQSIAVQNESVTVGGIPSVPARTFTLSQKTNAGTTLGFLNDYPINTVKLRPGLNNIQITAGANGARISGVSVVPDPDANYVAPYINDSHGGSAALLWTGAYYNQSPQAFEALRGSQPLVVSNVSSYVQPYFKLVPDYDAISARWRFRGAVVPGSAFYLGQQQSTSVGVMYAYKLSFDGTNAVMQIRLHDGTLQTVATVALAVAATGQDVTVDITSTATSWSLWVNGTLIYSDTIPLSICHVYAGNTNAAYRTYLNAPLRKGPNASDTGALIGEQYISFVDGKLHFVNTAGADKSVAFA